MGQENGVAEALWGVTIAVFVLVVVFCAIYAFWPPVRGDINQDGKLTREDAQLAEDFILLRRLPTVTEITAADVNHDGRLTSSDLTILERRIQG